MLRIEILRLAAWFRFYYAFKSLKQYLPILTEQKNDDNPKYDELIFRKYAVNAETIVQ